MRPGVPAEPTVRLVVTVTFLRIDRPPVASPALPPPLPPDTAVVRVAAPTVGFYRYLYNGVGAAHAWWLRRILSDAELAAVLRQPSLSIHVLYRGGAPAGFYELERRGADVNLSYFGLLPHALGTGLGSGLLSDAMRTGWAMGARAMTVNTCTADSPRALPGYLRQGFAPLREVREVWDIPVRLGLVLPPGTP